FVSTSFIFSKNRRASAPDAPNFSSISRAVFQPVETSLNTSLLTSVSTARRIGTSSATSLTTLMRFKYTDALDIQVCRYKLYFARRKNFTRAEEISGTTFASARFLGRRYSMIFAVSAGGNV